MGDFFDTTVAVVGMGPTGGVLANLLGARGVRVDVFERDVQVHPRPRGVHLDGEAMRVLQQIGVAERIGPMAMPVTGMDLLDPGGRLLFRYAAPAPPGPLGWAEGYMVHQPDLERELRRRAAEHPSVSLHAGTEVERIDLLPDGGAALRVRTRDGTRRVRARFVVGCCGARSITRAAVGSGLFDYGRHQPWLVVDVALRRELPLPGVTVQYCDPARPATYVPMPGNRRRFEIRVMPGDDAAALAEEGAVRERLARWLQPDDYEVERAAVYTFHALVADRWRRGPLLIAGDAAHQMPPFLGQGMCAGIRDAANLAWKLELVARGVASPSLLDTYQAEREPHVRRIIEADL
ncbi:MAG TPA: bifunctional 3-(3-hydroxy-phenyl)propionate/3-hydroxycinnamic acid hydroxylase, partial [Longimicrobiaceae bacterium]|nr:bifunctional 3-(3-hydroxy-phenyl)propionate/3-hydroxycinnamic acid hydroxylase [Longimicrobiaceae bacterium]